MANEPLESIKFPGIADKFTVPAVDNTLTVQGAVADAKAVGDALNNLNVDATLTRQGKPADAKKVGDEISDLKADLDHIKLAFEPCYNLFDPNAKVVGLLRSNNGVVDSSYTAYMASEYMPVNVGDSIRAQYDVNGVRKDSGADTTLVFYSTAFYDSTKTFIQDSGGNGVRVATAPQNAKYFRFSLKNDKYESVSNLAVFASAESTILPYMAYGSIGDIKEDRISDSYDAHIEELVDDALENLEIEITPRETTFFYISKNLINPSTRISGEYVNQNSGVIETNAEHTRSDYVPVNASTDYVLRTEDGAAGFRYFFYTATKTPIADSGALMPTPNDMIISSPSTAAFVIVSLNTGTSPWMLAEYLGGNKVFESYDYAHLYPRYIQDTSVEFFNLPPKIYATTGLELNVYFSALTENWEQYSWKVTCTKGAQWERGYRFTPADTDEGTYDITFTIQSKEQIPIIEKTASLIVSAEDAGDGESKSVIILGDSTTNNGTVIAKLHEDFNNDPMTITTLGTRGTAPNNHEGRAGWALYDYFTRESTESGSDTVYNPFYNPTTQTFDAAYYFANSGIAQPNWFIINMGINDMFNMKTDATANATAETCIGYLNDMITSIKGVSSNIKIGICVTIPPNDNQDAFGKAYKLRQTRDRYKRDNLILANKIISEFSGKESNGIYVIPIYLSLDTKYNMGMESIPVNSRNATTYESPVLNGGVHPAESGYWQIADVYTAFLKAYTT